MNEITDEACYYTTAQAASLLMISERRVQQLAKEGWFKPVKRNCWRLVDLVHGYIKYQKANQKSHVDLATEARTKEINQRIEMRDQRLIERDEVKDIFNDIANEFWNSFELLKQTIPSATKDHDKTRKVIAASQQEFSYKCLEKAKRLVPEIERTDQ